MSSRRDCCYADLLAVFRKYEYDPAEVVGALCALAVVELGRHPGPPERTMEVLEMMIEHMRSDLQERLAGASVKH